MSEQTQTGELDHGKEKQFVYYKKIDTFEKHWDVLGRKISLSERMLYFHKDRTDKTEIRLQYCKKIADLFCTLDHNMFEPKRDDVATSKIGVLDNETAFEQFKEKNLNNPKYAGKYVVFVNGSYQGANEKRSDLVKTIYKRFGNVKMFVDRITSEEREILLDSPE